MASHEILTVQLGHLSNYVGAHYWNQQDEYFAQVRMWSCSDVLSALLRALRSRCVCLCWKQYAQGSDGAVNYTDFFEMDRLYRSGVSATLCTCVRVFCVTRGCVLTAARIVACGCV